MYSHITNQNGTMYVATIDTNYVTWVSTKNKQNAQRFPIDQVEEWAKLATKISEIPTTTTTPTRPGLL